MRVLTLVIVIAFLALGALFGALNPQVVSYDFLFGSIKVSKGTALLLAMLVGWLLGGALCWAGSGLARQRKAMTAKRARDEKP